MKKSFRLSEPTPVESNLSRRDFIKVAGVIAGSAALAACAPQVTATSTPVESTATLPPVPTATHTPEAHFPAEVVEEFENSKVFRLDSSGKIYVISEDGEEQEIKGLTVDNLSGKITLKYGEGENDKDEFYTGKTFEIDSKTIVIDDTQRQITFKETAEAGSMVWVIKDTGLKIPERMNDAENPEAFPFVDFNTGVFSPEFDAHLIDLLNKNRFPEMSPEAVPFERIIVPVRQTEKLEAGGYSPAIDIPDDIAIEYRGGKVEKIPLQLGAVFKTTFLDGTPMYILVGQWKDKDGIKLVKYLAFDRSKDLGINSLSTYLGEGYGFNSSKRIQTGIIYRKDSKAGDGALNTAKFAGFNDAQTFSNWYYENKELFQNDIVISRWSETGIIENNDQNGNSKIPIFISGIDSI